MNNYLSNLAARSLNPTPALRPRLSSRFEPLEPGGPRLLAERNPLEMETSELEIAPPVAARGVRGRRASSLIVHIENENELTAPSRSGRIETPTDAGPITRTLEQPQLTVRQPAEFIGVQSEIHAIPDRVATPAVTERIETLQPSQQKVPQQEPLQGKNNEEEESARPSLERRLPKVIRDEVVIKEIFARDEVGRGVNDGDKSESLLSQSKPPSMIIPCPRESQVFGYQNGVKMERAIEKAPTPAPVIHVTIGRVEVRATQSTSQSTPKPRPARPTMSLDDYLRRRGDGGSR